MQAQVNAAQFRPPRLNFAGVCIRCGVPGCDSRQCVADHDRSWWAPCPECVGGTVDDPACCYCTYGVMEMESTAAAQKWTREFFRSAGTAPIARLREVA